MGNFDIAFEKTSLSEGAYDNNPNDHGGETCNGIARNFFPYWKGWYIVDAAKLRPNFPDSLKVHPQLPTLIKEHYKIEFWDKIDGDKIVDQEIANELFDCSVNMGISAAIKIFQKSLNLLFDCQLKEDGAIGPKTLSAHKVVMPPYTICRLDRALLAVMLCLRGQRYVYISDQNVDQRGFFRGWIRRILKTISW